MATPASPHASPQQRLYARWLDAGTKIGFLVLVAAFTAYVLGVVPPKVPLEDLPRLWSLPVEEYLAATGVREGWGWVEHALKGDYMNLVGVTLLSSVTIVCYVRLLPVLWSERDRAFVAIVILEIAVLLLAASGVLGGGH